MKIKNVFFIIGSLFIGNGLTAMVPEQPSLQAQFVQIFQYSEKCPDKECIVQALSCELNAVCTLLELVDKGVRLSVVQTAALHGLLDMLGHALPLGACVATDIRSQLMSLRLFLQGKIRTEKQPCDFSIFNNPNMSVYYEPIDRSYCGSPDQP